MLSFINVPRIVYGQSVTYEDKNAPNTETDVRVSVTGNTDLQSKTIGGQWTVTNQKGEVKLSDLAIRYYFTKDNDTSIISYVDKESILGSELFLFAFKTGSRFADSLRVVKRNQGKSHKSIQKGEGKVHLA